MHGGVGSVELAWLVALVEDALSDWVVVVDDAPGTEVTGSVVSDEHAPAISTEAAVAAKTRLIHRSYALSH